ncbi:MAG: hypothetical protein A2Y38_00280 [Spirochaetes bacterium GWB1_59_5]|nr:MAG: hypothetical protein A2Y38_00280 [Spirochaetes bacterium GWB1_59_5]
MLYKLLNDYHTQRNNAIDPGQSCNVTSMIMALAATGIPFKSPEGIQPEDHLSALLATPEAFTRRDQKYPWAKVSNVHPREVHELLSWAVNELLVGKPCTVFTTRASIQELLFRIARHQAASVVSGRFTKAGHIVALVGFECSGPDLSEAASPAAVDLAAVSRIIIDDPWGDVRVGYRDVDGDDVSLSVVEFDHYTRDYYSAGRKWAHLFTRTGII